jgi:hypothetical protein
LYYSIQESLHLSLIDLYHLAERLRFFLFDRLPRCSSSGVLFPVLPTGPIPDKMREK